MVVDDTGQIDLASAMPFRIGPMTAEPALRQVSTTTTSSETLQPRVMQVLVVLARANGAIVSRDALVRQCWEGRIVGDDSINRVISRLRRLSEERAGGSFQIETIVKVGYRLIGDVALVASAVARPLALDVVPGSTVVPAGGATAPAARMWRPRLIAVVAGLVVLLALGLWWNRAQGPTAAPALAVDRFATSGVSADTAETLRSAVVSAIAPEKFRVIPGRGSAADYRLTGRLTGSPDGATLYAELHAPGVTEAIWTPQKQFAANTPLSGVGSELAWAARCIIDGANEPPVPKPAAALAGWASYCDENSKDTYDEARQLEALRSAVRAEPRFASAQVTLAFFLGERVKGKGGHDPDGLRAEGLRAAAAAEALDPNNAEVFLARYTLSNVSDFKSKDALIARALHARPTGWGHEFQTQGHFLVSVGRLREALEAYRRDLAITPGNAITTLATGDVLSMTGRYGEARAIFAREAAIRGDRSRIDQHWLRAAISGGDWETARRLLPTEPDERLRAAMEPLVAALATGDRAAARAAGAPIEAMAVDSAALTSLMVMALAASGRDVAAVDAAGRNIDVTGPGSLRILYWPALAPARQTPEFEALVRKIGLFDYWHASGHRPDFCAAARAPALCAKL